MSQNLQPAITSYPLGYAILGKKKTGERVSIGNIDNAEISRTFAGAQFINDGVEAIHNLDAVKSRLAALGEDEIINLKSLRIHEMGVLMRAYRLTDAQAEYFTYKNSLEEMLSTKVRAQSISVSQANFIRASIRPSTLPKLSVPTVPEFPIQSGKFGHMIVSLSEADVVFMDEAACPGSIRNAKWYGTADEAAALMHMCKSSETLSLAYVTVSASEALTKAALIRASRQHAGQAFTKDESIVLKRLLTPKAMKSLSL